MNSLEKLFSKKLTENGDEAYNTTGDYMLDILFMTEYYSKHLDEAYRKFSSHKSDKDKLFSMFIRDPRFGLGRRDLGALLEKLSEVSLDNMVKAGRYDDLLAFADKYDLKKEMQYLWNKCLQGDQLAKKWMPRLYNKDKALAKAFCKVLGVSEKEYRRVIKVDTTESKLSSHRIDEINFEQVPSLALIKYYNRFMKEDRFKEYLNQVKQGKKKINTSVTTVYDIYKNRDKIDADLFFDKLEKISINCIPILDTSGSMWDSNDSIGKAISIAYYLAKCSTYCNNQVVSFSSQPHLITIKESNKCFEKGWWSKDIMSISPKFGVKNRFSRELNSMYTGDYSNTDFGAVIKLLSKLDKFPEYFVVLSDMEFDRGSSKSKSQVMQMLKEKGIKTKIVWWNFNSRSTTSPELDEYGNIYMSGYSPMLLKFLQTCFNAQQFLDKLLEEYKKNIEK